MPDAEDRPNVLFLLSDQHSHRHVGYRGREDGGEPVRTPTLDGLAERGVAFENAYCPMPLCSPSRLCMLTGREQANAGAWSNGSPLRYDVPTFADALGDAGYRTGLVGKMHLGGRRQLAGFDERPYGDLLGMNGHQYEPVSPEDRHYTEARPVSNADAGLTEYPESQLQERQVIGESMAWLREQRHEGGDDPWLLTASFSRPHHPYTAPPRHFERYWPDGVTEPPVGEGDGDLADHPVTAAATHDDRPEATARARAAYMACVDYLDELLGDFLAMLDREGFLENTVVVYTSDHGEMAGEHGLWDKNVPHEASSHVPMVVQTPAHRSGDLDATTVETPVSLTDLFPTFCGFADADVPEGVDGEDLSGALRRNEEPDRGPVFTDDVAGLLGDGLAYRMVREGRYKYVRFRDAPELFFDLEADPNETENLAGEATGEAAEALDRLRALVDETVDFEAAAERREREEVEQEDLGLPTGTAGNAYLLGDGRVVDADAVVTKPDVLVGDAERVFRDYSGDD